MVAELSLSTTLEELTANITMPDSTEKEVYRITEIRELETKKLAERQERIVENYYWGRK